MRCESPDVTFIKIHKFVTGFKFQGSAKARYLLGPSFGSAHRVSDFKVGGLVVEAGLSGGLTISLCVDRILKDIQNLKCEDKSLVLKTED